MSDRKLNMATLDEEALRWAKALPQATEAEREAFAAWIRRSPENLGAFLKHNVLKAELRSLDPERTIDVGRFLERAKRPSKVVPWPGAVAKHAHPQFNIPPATIPGGTRRTQPRWFVSGALVLALVALTTWWYQAIRLENTKVYTTNFGQQRKIVLRDGSVIELNTQSAVRVEMSATARSVYLLGGEALFDVKHNSAVPFRVHANGTLIEDLGTQFNVNSHGDATTVSVIEGVVQLSVEKRGAPTVSEQGSPPDVVLTTKEFHPLRQPALLSAGEQASIVADGTLIQKRPLNVAQATAWRHGRIAFIGAPLSEIVAEFNRYNVRKIRIHGEALRERRYSGAFDAHDPRSFIDFLREDTGIEIEDSNQALVLREH